MHHRDLERHFFLFSPKLLIQRRHANRQRLGWYHSSLSIYWVSPLFLEKEMAIHSSILAWRIPWTEEPGGLQSMGSQRVGHDWATSLPLSLVPGPMSPKTPFPPSSSFQYHFFASLKLQLKPHFSPDIFLSNLVFTDRPFLQNSIIWQVNNLVLYSVPTYIVSWLLHTSHQSSSVHRVLRTDK